MNTIGLSYIVPTLVLMGALCTDLRTRKIYNKWVLISIVVAIANSYYFFGWDGLEHGAEGGGLALLMTVPLVLLGALGAGDMKILFAFGLGVTYSDVFAVLILSLLWGALIGLTLALKRGKGKTLMKNTAKILTARPSDKTTYQTMPYTVALFLAWLTYLLLGTQQGALL